MNNLKMAVPEGTMAVFDDVEMPPRWFEDWIRGFEERLAKIVSPSSVSDVLTTEEAALYLRHSTSWLLKRNDISYIKGLPNTYQRKDLDAWIAKCKVKPRVI